MFENSWQKRERPFVGQWAAPFLLLGVYSKMVKQPEVIVPHGKVVRPTTAPYKTTQLTPQRIEAWDAQPAVPNKAILNPS